MKKICICLMAIMLLLCGCGTPYNPENSNYEKELDDGYFVEINYFESYEHGIHMTYKMVYAKDTKVKYLIAIGNSVPVYGITPLYNADGTLQVYDN